MDKWISLNNQSAGRDKLARLVQYLSRLVWDLLEQRDCNPALVDQFKTLEYILSSFRKLLRFGKCLDVFYNSLKTIHYPDVIIRVTLTFSKLSQALFLVADHMVWLARTGLFRTINAKKWTKTSNKYWLLAIIMNLARDVYEIMRLVELHRNGRRSGITQKLMPQSMTTKEFSRAALRSYTTILGHKDVVVDTVKNVCDVFIPLTALGYTRLTPTTIGVLGAISSVAGLISLIQPTAKLVPM